MAVISEKLPNIYGEPVTGDIAHHKLTRDRLLGRDGVEVEFTLPLPPDAIEQSFRQRFPNCRNSTIKKVMDLLDEAHLISKKQKNGESGSFQVSNHWAENIISRIEGRRPLSLLCEMGFIEKIIPHRSTICPRATTYRFKLNTFKKYKIIVRGQLRKKIRLSGKRGNERRKKDPVHSWVDSSLARITLDDSELDEYRERPGHGAAAVKFASGIRIQKWKGSYRWNNVCQIPQDLRDKLLFDGQDPVRRLDISCSFGIMLPWLFADDTGSQFSGGRITTTEKNKRAMECKELRAFLSRGDFYNSLLPHKPRREAKSAFQRYLNTAALDPIAKTVSRNFRQRFPECAKMISRRKRPPRSGQKKSNQIFAELQGRQTEIINSVILHCRASSIPCIPVSDELVVPFVNGVEVQQWMLEEIYERTGVNAKVGGRRFGCHKKNKARGKSKRKNATQSNLQPTKHPPLRCRHLSSIPNKYPDLERYLNEVLIA